MTFLDRRATERKNRAIVFHYSGPAFLMLNNPFTGFCPPKQNKAKPEDEKKISCPRFAAPPPLPPPHQKNNGLSVRQNGVYLTAVVTCLWWNEQNKHENKEKEQRLSENLERKSCTFMGFDT